MISETWLGDNMEYMKAFPTKFIDLAIVDPPYAINGSNGFNNEQRSSQKKTKKYEKKNWDSQIPPIEYFVELFRVSKNQIIWGGNYFFDYLPSTRCVLAWDKIQEFTGADFELAWTSFTSSAKTFRYSRVEAHGKGTIHPTQKPVALYKWLLLNYAKPGDKILDTHMGSQTSRIAAWDLEFDYYGCEDDPDYFASGELSFAEHKQKPTGFFKERELQIKRTKNNLNGLL
jgi:site-specific DNA-methyltransferase (adenine-specific)